jgi:hypothetical protein
MKVFFRFKICCFYMNNLRRTYVITFHAIFLSSSSLITLMYVIINMIQYDIALFLILLLLTMDILRTAHTKSIGS